ncbi:MAG: toxin TcdB middle/C-terminal domain-containing protein [bacterium]
MITQDEVLTWYPSLSEEGFDEAGYVRKPFDEERGPRLVFADGTQSIYLADMCGDGLTALVRIRNGEVCYWPNLGYGRFGAKVTMDDAPWFDNTEQFENGRIRLADIDGSGTNDIIYLARDGVRLYFNQSGNRWSGPRLVSSFPHLDNLSSVMTLDLLGNGTACLVWSSPLPADTGRPLRYIDLMGGKKPHLLVKTLNNFGAETVVHYNSSTRFYLQDKAAGKPWITKLPFPVHVVDRVETCDRISGNRFVTRYDYHHGYFDGFEREFRGFGMVEQRDTEEFAALNATQEFPVGTNVDESSHVPPVLTRTWFHTGVFIGRNHVSDFFAGTLDQDDVGEYYREPGLTDVQAKELLLDDTMLPVGLSVDEEREACRALKGSMLRQEIYALDGTTKEKDPYTVTEQNFTIQHIQPQGDNLHAVFLTHAREALSYHYERKPSDPRVAHALTLEVDDFGNVTKSASINYGRRETVLIPGGFGGMVMARNPGLVGLSPRERSKQTTTLITYTENSFTNSVPEDDSYRIPAPCETHTYELTGLVMSVGNSRFSLSEILTAGSGAVSIGYEQSPTSGVQQKRLIEHLRTLYRRNDLTAQLALGQLESLALTFEGYKLAFTPSLVTAIYAGRVTDAMLSEAGYVHSEGDANWWVPSGRVFYSPNSADSAAQEVVHAQNHFFLPHRYRDPFHTNFVSTETFVTYDAHDLLIQQTRDALGNLVTVGERDAVTNVITPGHDYRVLKPGIVMGPNRNRTAAVFDALGMVVGTALMGKPEDIPLRGDRLPANFRADLTLAEIDQFVADPRGPMAATLLNEATMRVVYDLTQYWREPNPLPKSPAFFATLARETHVVDPVPPGGLKIQVSFSYADGFSREIQRKIQAEAGPAPQRDANEKIVVDTDGLPVMTPNDVNPRWVGSGWTVFNNKGRPTRQYEPFFTDTHRFEFDVRIGVSSVFFYDPVERVVATLHPNHSWKKTVFDSWQQETWDANDTVLVADPGTDPDVRDFFLRLPSAEYLPGWYAQRQGGALGPPEQSAARKAAVHANTPALTHFDSLGRAFLTIAHNRFKLSDSPPADPPIEQFHRTFILWDIESNRREVTDALDRLVMHYEFDMLGNRTHRASMDSGERWMLIDVAGERLYSWDSRNQRLRTSYDPLRRATHSFLSVRGGAELLVGRTVYGETLPTPEANNLRGRVVEVSDQGGTVTSDRYDFKGNPLRSERRFALEYKSTLDWSAAVPLEAITYTNFTRYDALNRAAELIAPDNSIILPTYNEANLLERVEVNLRGEQQNGAPLWTSFITDIDYDAKGERTLIDFGNGVRTTYEYDRLNLRLSRLITRRDVVDFPNDCPPVPPVGWPGCQVQNIQYTYDPAGNVTHIRDDAQQIIYFRNRRVEPTAEFTYDAIYQLIESTGREHLGQTGNTANAPTAPDAFDNFHARLNHPVDGNAFGRYLDQYAYDAVGNILSVQHRGTDPAHAGWTRTYAYTEASQLEAAKPNNRLTSTVLGATTETYRYDSPAGLNGNITRMPHLPVIGWNFRDQLQSTSQQVVNSGTPETTWYVYDSTGRRVRKVTERQAVAGQTPTRMKERIYVGGFEVHREYGNDGNAIDLERETLHIMDDEQRIALVETRTAGVDPAPARLIRYQFGNHLGSAALELDHQGQIVSFEEYYPFGGTSYQAVRSQTETSKRYRYTGKERDEESGLYYFGVRYYASWLARWISPDPLELEDGVNVYEYVGNSPVKFVDLLGADKGDKLPEHSGKVGKFSEKEINDAIKTVYGELTFPAHTDTAAEAKAVASTILNRQARIETARKEFTVASTAKQKALTDLQKEQGELNTANAEFTKFTKDESKNKSAIRATIKEKDPKKKAALVNKAFADKVQELRDTINKEKADVKKAGGIVKDKQKDFEAAQNAKIDAESFVAKDKRNNSAITLTDIVEQHSQYAGTKKGKDDFAKFPKMDNDAQAKHKARYDAAVKAVEDLAKDPTKADKYIEFKGGNLRPQGALAGETKVGGNYFK